MSNSIRLRTTPNGGDKYLKLKLEQDFDFIEILSLNLSQEDAYKRFCSDYGVVVGRVIINSGFGVPNAKVSIFVPLDDVDKDDPLIRGIYPYEIITDKNSDGIRYNVLPKESESNNNCFTPIGTFPSKREVLDNETILNVYCKYYKFTTTTNHAGDFMFFGVPIGTYTVHVDADISDIGFASQRPYDLIRQGTPQKLFESATKFKGGTNLDKLPQVKTANMGVNVQPFWGDTEVCEIGITRVDVDLNYNIIPSAIFMGSIFGDQKKNSVNKQCRPRGKVGEICEQVAGTGDLEMIRKTLSGEIEDFDVDGGRLIDDDGTWAYQIPMNLDYMITDETGNMVLTEDTNIGIPTRSSVRFRIGMDETGGEGRLRTRAKYLVPNNPSNINEVDYSFGSKTKNSSFKDLYWNKIYTVSNFITRYQSNGSVSSRNMIGIKNVDGCAGDKTPFPYNRVNTKTNPIFFILCLLIKVIGFIIALINSTIIWLINKIVKIINDIIDFINDLGGNIDNVPYVPCITVQCETDNGTKYFAPGCQGGSEGQIATTPQAEYYCDDYVGHDCKKEPLVGWDDCISFEMAKNLGLFQFDFYNDWVTGTLFGFLLKYKKRKKGTEKFCEFDCNDFTNDSNYSGVDGNKNNKPDNICQNHRFMDSCFSCGSDIDDDCQKEYKEYTGVTGVREGVIKKYEGVLYYAATRHNVVDKLYATDLICLGSVFDCDWQGFPKLQPFLVESTYKIPPDIEEGVELISGNEVTSTTGMVDIGGNTKGLFFHVNCLGIHTNEIQCLNVRHICEMGVDIDEMIEDSANPLNPPVLPDGVIGSNEIDEINKQFRDSYLVLNSGSTLPNVFNLGQNQVITSDFNTNNVTSYYNFASDYGNNGTDYLNFRALAGDSFYTQPKHSFFMYFGLLPGKTALDKMNDKYFTTCRLTPPDDIVIDTTVTADINGTNSGELTFTFVGGIGPYTYSVIDQNGVVITNGVVSIIPPNLNVTPVFVNGLSEGSYTINAYDSAGNQVSQTISLAGPTPFYCNVLVTKNVTTAGSTDGEIQILAGGGNTNNYTYTITDSNGVPSGNQPSGLLSPNPKLISGLGVDISGYTVTVTDGVDTCIKTGLTVNGPTVLNVLITKTNVICDNGQDGKIEIKVSGGQQPYSILTTGPASFTSNLQYISPIRKGTYITTVVDSNSQTFGPITTNIISQYGPIVISLPQANVWPVYKQCSSTLYRIPYLISAWAGVLNSNNVIIEYRIDNGAWLSVNDIYTGPNTVMFLEINKNLVSSDVKLRISNGTCRSNILTYNVSAMILPTTELNGSMSYTTSGSTYIHTVSASGGIGSLTGSSYNIGSFTSTTQHLSTTITDSVGCTKTLSD